MTRVTCRLTAKNQDQLWNPALGNRVWATFTFFMIAKMEIGLTCLCVWSFIVGVAERPLKHITECVA